MVDSCPLIGVGVERMNVPCGINVEQLVMVSCGHRGDGVSRHLGETLPGAWTEKCQN